MRIHSDILTREDLERHVPAGATLELDERGSRKRNHAFEVEMLAEPGEDAHGVRRRYGAYHGGGKALTWVEYGDWMVELFKIDRQAIVGPYDGAHKFVLGTRAAAGGRPAFEQAPEATDRWCAELFPNGEHRRGVPLKARSGEIAPPNDWK